MIALLRSGLNATGVYALKTKPVATMSTTMSKPSWDEYFTKMAVLVSSRSPDPSTKHGCVIVNERNVVVSTGYNGPVNGIDDTQVVLTRPEKYAWLIHAEENAVLFATCPLKGCTAYITGPPCSACFRRFCQVGIVRVVCGSVRSASLTSEEQGLNDQLAKLCGVCLEVCPLDLPSVSG